MAETALAQRDVKVGNYGLAQIISDQLWKTEELAKSANLLFPVTALDALPPMHKPSISVITVNPNPAAKEVYPIAGGQHGLSKHVILKMLAATGATCHTRKLTPETDLDNIRWQAVVTGKLPDGHLHTMTGSKAWSWQKCQEQMSAQQAKQYRQFADEQTETKAILRAARAFLSIKTSYNQEELSKPFLIARSVPDLDMSDPEIRREYARSIINQGNALYGAPPSDMDALPAPEFPALPAEATDAEYREDDEPDPQQTAIDPAEQDYDPNAPAPTADMEGERLAWEAKVAAMAKGAASGGIGKAIGPILQKYGVTTWIGQPLDTLQVIYQDAIAVRQQLGKAAA